MCNGLAENPKPAEYAPRRTLHDAMRAFERDYISQCLRSHGGSLSRCARDLGMDRSNLSKKLAALGIKPVNH